MSAVKFHRAGCWAGKERTVSFNEAGSRDRCNSHRRAWANTMIFPQKSAKWVGSTGKLPQILKRITPVKTGSREEEKDKFAATLARLPLCLTYARSPPPFNDYSCYWGDGTQLGRGRGKISALYRSLRGIGWRKGRGLSSNGRARNGASSNTLRVPTAPPPFAVRALVASSDPSLRP